MVRAFDTTRWSVVLAVGDDDSGVARAALGELYSAYWYPLYAYLRRDGEDAEEASDLLQGYFLRMLETRTFARADPEAGSFRSYLLATLRHHRSHERARRRAQKRGGGVAPLPIDFALGESRYAAELTEPIGPEELFERRWATTLLERALGRLEAEARARGLHSRLERLLPFLTQEGDGDLYARVGAELGLAAGGVKTAVHRLRRRLGQLLRDEIAATVVRPESVEAELAHLRTILGRRP